MNQRLIYTKQGMKPILMIADYEWWTTNQEKIEEWMTGHLPRGTEHQQGMVLTFDTDADAMMFMLRWG